jgi:hypothetical protein
MRSLNESRKRVTYLPAVASVRCTREEREKWAADAKAAGITLSEYARRTLSHSELSEHRRALLGIISERITLGHLLAAQDGEDLTDAGVLDEIEREAIAKAEALVERRLMLIKSLEQFN